MTVKASAKEMAMASGTGMAMRQSQGLGHTVLGCSHMRHHHDPYRVGWDHSDQLVRLPEHLPD